MSATSPRCRDGDLLSRLAVPARDGANLSVEQRAILSLRYLEDLNVERVADTRDIPLGTAKCHLHHARAALEERLERRPA